MRKKYIWFVLFTQLKGWSKLKLVMYVFILDTNFKLESCVKIWV